MPTPSTAGAPSPDPENETHDGSESRSLIAEAAIGVELAVTGGLQPGAKLRENRLFRLTALGVQFQGEPTFEQWQHGLLMVKLAKNSLHLWLTDFLRIGRAQFGDDRVQEALVQMEFPQLDVTQALAIGALSEGARHSALTSEHYYVISKAGLDETAQERWAAEAVEHGLSAHALEVSIQAGKVLTGGNAGGAGGRGGLNTFQGFRQMFETVYQRVEKNDPIETWEDARLRELWEELKGPVHVGIQIANKLGIDPESGGRA